MADVAVLGTGRMGAAMVRRLIHAGHFVTAWNRTPASVITLRDELGDRLAVAEGPVAAVKAADVVITMLASGVVTEEVLLDPVLVAALHGRTVVDHGTSGVETARRLQRELAAADARFVDAPVSGSVPAVNGGTLLVMASGRSDAIEHAEPVISAYARKVLRVGEAGSGQVMKLAVNLIVHDLNAAVSEALRLAESSSVSREAAYDVFTESVVGAPFVQYKRAAFLDPETPVAMSLELVAKDLDLITAHAAAVGADVPVTRCASGEVRAAVDAGFGLRDMADLSRFA